MAVKFNVPPGEQLILQENGVFWEGKNYGGQELYLTRRNIYYAIYSNWTNKLKDVVTIPINTISIHDGKAMVSAKKAFLQKSLIIYANNEKMVFLFENSPYNVVEQWANTISQMLLGQNASSSTESPQAIPGTEFIANTIKGTVDTFASAFGIKGKHVGPKEMVNARCISCSAPLSGPAGSTVHCKYCDTDQVLK